MPKAEHYGVIANVKPVAGVAKSKVMQEVETTFPIKSDGSPPIVLPHQAIPF